MYSNAPKKQAGGAPEPDGDGDVFFDAPARSSLLAAVYDGLAVSKKPAAAPGPAPAASPYAAYGGSQRLGLGGSRPKPAAEKPAAEKPAAAPAAAATAVGKFGAKKGFGSDAFFDDDGGAPPPPPPRHPSASSRFAGAGGFGSDSFFDDDAGGDGRGAGSLADTIQGAFSSTIERFGH